MTGDHAASAAPSRRRLSDLGLLAVLGFGVLWGAYAASESMRPLPFQFVVAPLAIGTSMLVAVFGVIIGAGAGVSHHPRLRRWLYRAAGLAVAGTVLGTILALAVLSPPSPSP